MFGLHRRRRRFDCAFQVARPHLHKGESVQCLNLQTRCLRRSPIFFIALASFIARSSLPMAMYDSARRSSKSICRRALFSADNACVARSIAGACYPSMPIGEWRIEQFLSQRFILPSLFYLAKWRICLASTVFTFLARLAFCKTGLLVKGLLFFEKREEFTFWHICS